MAAKRLMVLGAGPYQAPGIKAAAALGHYVVSLDYLPGNIGHKFSHHFAYCDTTDKTEVLRLVNDLQVDGLVTFASDVAIPSLAFVCSRLGLPGPGIETAAIMCSKVSFRAFQKANKLPHPGFYAAPDFDSLWAELGREHTQLVFKPADSSGSRGVTLAGTDNKELCREAFNCARSFSRSGQICVEEFVSGKEYGGDALLSDGKIAFICFTEKIMDSSLVTGHRTPSGLDQSIAAAAKAMIEKHCCLAGYNSGPLNFDFIVRADGTGAAEVIILEMSPRSGGNGIPEVIFLTSGIDIYRASINHALGCPILPPEPGSSKALGAAAMVIRSQHGGLLRALAPLSDVMACSPKLRSVAYFKEAGEKIEAFSHGGHALGLAVFECCDRLDYEGIVSLINNALALEVK